MDIAWIICVLIITIVHQHGGAVSIDYSSSDMLQCRRLHIIRDWPQIQADGYYDLTNTTCDTNYPEHYYEKQNDQKSYFYRISPGYWVLYGTVCSEENYGMTSESIEKPWLTEFNGDVGAAVTSISCVDYVERITHPSTTKDSTWELPAFKQKQPEVTYSLEVILPDNVESVTFKIEAGGGGCSSGHLGIFVHNVSEEFELCSNKTQHVFNASYEAASSPKSFKLKVEYHIQGNEGATVKPFLILNYSIFPHDIVTDTIYDVSTSVSQSTPDPAYSYMEYVTEMTVSPTDEFSSNGELQSNVSMQTPDIENDLITIDWQSTEDEYSEVNTTRETIYSDYDQDKSTVSDSTILDLNTVGDNTVRPGPILPDVPDVPDVPHIPDVIASVAPEPDVTTSDDPGYDAVMGGSYGHAEKIIIVLVVLVALVVIIVAIVCVKMRNKRNKPVLPVDHDDERALVPQEKREFQPMVHQRTSDYNSRKSRPFSRSSNSSFRASPKSRRQTMEDRPKESVDPDRFSLSGCITPLAEAPDNPFSTFTSAGRTAEEPKVDHDSAEMNNNYNNSPHKYRPLSTTDDDVFADKLKIDPIQMPPEPVEDHNKPADTGQVERRSKPAGRNSSCTESAVYEIRVEAGQALDLDDVCNVYGTSDDSHLTTRL